MALEFVPEVLTQKNLVLKILGGELLLVELLGIPDLHLIEEMEAGVSVHADVLPFFVRAKENGGSKNALEAVDESAVVGAVFGKAESFQNLGCAFEVDEPIFAPERERRHPDRNEAVLAEWKTVIGVAGDLKDKLSIAALVFQDIFFRSFHGQATQNEGPRTVDKLLLLGRISRAGHFDGLNAAELPFGNDKISPLPLELTQGFARLNDVAGLLHQSPALRDRGAAVLGKEIIQRFFEHVLDAQVAPFEADLLQLPRNGRVKESCDGLLPFPAGRSERRGGRSCLRSFEDGRFSGGSAAGCLHQRTG